MCPTTNFTSEVIKILIVSINCLRYGSIPRNLWVNFGFVHFMILLKRRTHFWDFSRSWGIRGILSLFLSKKELFTPFYLRLTLKTLRRSWLATVSVPSWSPITTAPRLSVWVTMKGSLNLGTILGCLSSGNMSIKLKSRLESFQQVACQLLFVDTIWDFVSYRNQCESYGR